MKQIALFIGGLGLMYWAVKFFTLTFTLLAAGQFFTPILAAIFTVPCAIFGFILIAEALQ